MDAVHYELAIGKMDEAMATAARERRASSATPRNGMLARLRSLFAAR